MIVAVVITAVAVPQVEGSLADGADQLIFVNIVQPTHFLKIYQKERMLSFVLRTRILIKKIVPELALK